jgi:signal transduction histidine kinase
VIGPLRRLAGRTRALYRAVSGSIASRLILGAGFTVAVAFTVAAIAIPALFRSGLERALDDDVEYYVGKLIWRVVNDGKGGLKESEPMTERDFESAYSGYYWQIEGDGKVLAASRSLGGKVLATRTPAKVNTEVNYDILFQQAPDGAQKLRAVSRRIEGPSLEKDLTYSVAVPRTDLDYTVGEFSLTVAITILGLGLVVVGTMFLQVRYGLRPLRRIPAALADIRSGETDRLTGSFVTEVEPLAREINALLDHNAEVVERARTHVGNLAHALKTPIAVLTNEAEGRDGEFARTVATQVGTMRDQVEHHLSRARMAARAGVLGARTSVMPILEGLARTLDKIYRERNLSITVEGPPDIAFRGERQDLEDLLGNLLDNACKFARTRVAAKAVARDGERLRIEIADDGPGVPSEHRRAAQKRGVRLDESAPGSGLGLSIVKDIAEIYGGSFSMGEAHLGGLLAILDLPLAGGPAPRKAR